MRCLAVTPDAGSLAAKKELQEAKQRENESSMRAAALEAEVEQSRVIKQEMQLLLEDTAQRLQVRPPAMSSERALDIFRGYCS